MSRKTKSDPTGQARNRNKGTRRLSARLTNAERDIKAMFRRIPRTSRRETRIVNADQNTIYDYEWSAQQEQAFESSVEFTVNQQLLETQTGTMPLNWYWRDDIELPYRQGTVEEVRDYNALVVGAVATGATVAGLPPQQVPVDQVLLSEPYRSALNNVQVSNFTVIKSLSDRTSAQVMQVVNSGIQGGESPRLIAENITKRFNVARSNAKRISETEVNRAYNDAKLRAVDILGDKTGLRSGVIHISALSFTTRDAHAARHGNAYTVADQTRWWNTGSNRINCKCTTRAVLIDRNGNVVQSELQDELKREREFFDND